MFQVVIGVILLVASGVLFFTDVGLGRMVSGLIRRLVASVVFLLSVFMFAGTSYVFVGADEVVHLKQIYGGNSLSSGKILATDGENGFQAEVLSPGFHVSPLISVINDIDYLPVVEIPAGFYGRITTKDGTPLPEGAIMARSWSDGEFGNMLDAKHFLKNGGQKGLQASILKPGKYRMNLYLYNVEFGNGSEKIVYSAEGKSEAIQSRVDTRITNVPAGHVAVVKSNITEEGVTCVEKTESASFVEGALSAPLVPRGCKGIWKEALPPADYFLNRDAYEVTLVDTRVKTWQYKGGFDKQFIDLTINEDGSINQAPRSVPIKYDSDVHADKAIFVKVEGWDVPQEVRVVVQVTPENAPIVVASVGGLNQVEDSVLTPAIRSIVRNVVGSTITYTDEKGESVTRPTHVLDLIENREIIEDNVEKLVALEGRKAGVNIREVRFGEPAIPPGLLVARQIEQLSSQLQQAFAEQRKAQEKRIETEAARATADQQSTLVTQQIANQRAELKKQELQDLGEGEKLRLIEIAEGQKAQALVLGEDRVMMLQMTDKVLGTLAENPELITLVGKLVPNTVVTGGDSGGLAGAAALLGGLFSNKNDEAAAVPSKK